MPLWQAIEDSGYSRKVLMRAYRKGQLHLIRVGTRNWSVRRKELARWIESL